VSESILDAAKTIDGIPLAAGSRVRLDRNGNIIEGRFGAPYKIKDITISAGTMFSFKPHYSVGMLLHGSGTVTKGDLEFDCSLMQIYKHGVIAWGRLKKPAVINNQELPAGTALTYAPSGELIEFKLP